MKIIVTKSSEQLGRMAARQAAERINKCISEKGKARVLFSTGASQFDMFKALVRENVDWEKVAMFHLDEYVNLSPDHPASFRKYLNERFVSKVPLGEVHFVDGTEGGIAKLNAIVAEEPIDLGMIGVGENAHIAFNDPPADFDTETPCIIVALD